MAWVAEETFDSYSDGDLHGGNGGTGWASGWNTSFAQTALDVAGTPTPFQGAKIASYTTTGGTYSERQLSADVSGAFVMYVAIRAGQTNGGGARFNLRNTSSQGRVNIQFDQVDAFGSAGNIYILSSPSTATTLVSGYSANTWYVFRITGNTTAGTFTVAYATAAYGASETGAWSSESASQTMFNSGDLRYAAINTENTGADYFFDYISGTTPYSTATNVTVNASVLSGTFSTQAPTETGGATVSPSVLAATFSVQSATELIDEFFTPAQPLTATFSVPAPNIITPDAQIDVSAPLSAVFSTPAPTASGDAPVAIGAPLAATFSTQAITVSAGAGATPSALSATFSTPAPVITAIGNITVSPNALEATFSLQDPDVTAEQNASIAAGVLSATFTLQTPTVTAIRNVELTATTLVATFSVQTPRRAGGLWTAQPRVNGDAAWTPQPRAI